jgi:AcrR family transcriptional regulator
MVTLMSNTTAATRPVGTKGMPRHERERLILEAASTEFGEKGYALGSLTVVAATAGISKPLILEYFGSKDRLYLACLDCAGTTLASAVEAAQVGPTDITRAIRTLAAIFNVLGERLYDWELVYDRTIPDTGPIQEAAAGYRLRLNATGTTGAADFIVSINEPDPLDADILTHIWYATIASVIGWWRHHPDHTAADMAIRCERVFAAFARSALPLRQAPDSARERRNPIKKETR